MRVLVLTSTFRRHHFVVNHLAAFLRVVGVWQEAKSFEPVRYAQTPDEEAVITAHFARRDAAEARDFEGHERLVLASGTVHRMVAAGRLGDPSEVDAMKQLVPDVVLVFGTGLLRAPLISAFEGRLINLHLGLSPYYRGAGTNFWPLVNREPEYVGATIHYLDAGIDTGSIIAHARPRIAPGDGPHAIGNKAIRAAVETLVGATQAHVAGRVHARPQWARGRLYQRKDFNADAVRTLYRQFETGMIDEYLGDQARRDARLDLVALEATA